VIEQEMKIGPKGQVVIPHSMRKALKIRSGSKVIFRLYNNKLILEKPNFDSIAVFEKIAKKGPSITKIDPHAYEEELAERNP
jgi:AbrB family looped-hinge helix DNA binding protein